MKRLALIAALSAIALPAMAQPFPPPGSYNSTKLGPYTHYNGGNWGGQSTTNGPYTSTTYSTPDGKLHACNSTTIGEFTSTNCN
jgi:hypothetical protein